MADIHFPKATREHGELRHKLAPAPDDGFRAFSKAVFTPGALDARTKQLIAVAVAHVTQCPWCIEGHVKGARREGASREEIMEAIWVAAEMRAGATFAHSTKTLQMFLDEDAPQGADK
ncbi:MAG: carboxymuconolactone decarboxylase family protein [Rubellimicrobium sp.]|nr:carboxymuconolactone decarboxylase family protein [Rubellimicrobium sp.]